MASVCLHSLASKSGWRWLWGSEVGWGYFWVNYAFYAIPGLIGWIVTGGKFGQATKKPEPIPPSEAPRLDSGDHQTPTAT